MFNYITNLPEKLIDRKIRQLVMGKNTPEDVARRAKENIKDIIDKKVEPIFGIDTTIKGLDRLNKVVKPISPALSEIFKQISGELKREKFKRYQILDKIKKDIKTSFSVLTRAPIKTAGVMVKGVTAAASDVKAVSDEIKNQSIEYSPRKMIDLIDPIVGPIFNKAVDVIWPRFKQMIINLTDFVKIWGGIFKDISKFIFLQTTGVFKGIFDRITGRDRLKRAAERDYIFKLLSINFSAWEMLDKFFKGNIFEKALVTSAIGYKIFGKKLKLRTKIKIFWKVFKFYLKIDRAFNNLSLKLGGLLGNVSKNNKKLNFFVRMLMFLGTINSLGDLFKKLIPRSIPDLIEKIFDLAKGLFFLPLVSFKGIRNLLKLLITGVFKVLHVVGKKFIKITTGILSLARKIVSPFKTAGELIVAKVKEFFKILIEKGKGVIRLLISSVAGVLTSKYVVKIKNFTKRLFGNFKKLIFTATGAALSIFKLPKAVLDILKTARESAVLLFKSIKDFLSIFISKIKSIIQSIPVIGKIYQFLKEKLSTTASGLTKIKRVIGKKLPGMIAKRAAVAGTVTAASGPAAPVVGTVITAASTAWLVYDVIKMITTETKNVDAIGEQSKVKASQEVKDRFYGEINTVETDVKNENKTDKQTDNLDREKLLNYNDQLNNLNENKTIFINNKNNQLLLPVDSNFNIHF